MDTGHDGPHSAEEIRAFRYWIQGYARFYEPLVQAYFEASGYRIVRHPAIVGRRDIQRIIADLYDGQIAGSKVLPLEKYRQHLRGRTRMLPDFLLERGGEYFLAECKSWGGFGSGKFDLETARASFVEEPRQGAMLLVRRLEQFDIAGKILVVSSRSPDAGRVERFLADAFMTRLEILYLDEILREPQLRPAIERQLALLDAAVAELRADLLEETGGASNGGTQALE